jgi:hypothetical protein
MSISIEKKDFKITIKQKENLPSIAAPFNNTGSSNPSCFPTPQSAQVTKAKANRAGENLLTIKSNDWYILQAVQQESPFL